MDLTELERMFIEEGVASDDDRDRIRTEDGALGLFIRSLVGLDGATGWRGARPSDLAST